MIKEIIQLMLTTAVISTSWFPEADSILELHGAGSPDLAGWSIAADFADNLLSAVNQVSSELRVGIGYCQIETHCNGSGSGLDSDHMSYQFSFNDSQSNNIFFIQNGANAVTKSGKFS